VPVVKAPRAVVIRGSIREARRPLARPAPSHGLDRRGGAETRAAQIARARGADGTARDELGGRPPVECGW